jgi:hypothetical protein
MARDDYRLVDGSNTFKASDRPGFEAVVASSDAFAEQKPCSS